MSTPFEGAWTVTKHRILEDQNYRKVENCDPVRYNKISENQYF